MLEEVDFARYDSGGEGLYRRFYAAVRTAASVDELLGTVKTKRYASCAAAADAACGVS